jgi:hypothetical protein
MYEHRFKTSVSNGDHIYDERGNRSWNGMLFSSKKALLLNFKKSTMFRFRKLTLGNSRLDKKHYMYKQHISRY